MSSLGEIKNKNILVVGDIMVDSFIYGRGSRLSQEAPVPVVLVDNKVNKLGGACNVAANLSALGCGVSLCGIVGKDDIAQICAEMLDDAGIDRHLYWTEKEKTIHKTRVICDDQHIVRVDEERKFTIGAEGLEEKINETGDYDAVIISDYAKGTISMPVINLIKEKFYDKPIIVDPKPVNWKMYSGVTCITPNLAEAINMAGGAGDHDPEWYARYLKGNFMCDFMIVTLSDKGVIMIDDKDEMHMLDAHPISFMDTDRPQKRDVTGAGDTMISAFTASYCAGMSLRESLYIANVAAAIAVNKMGTEVCAYKELEEELNHA